MIDLKAIRAAAEAATPGPWEAVGPSFGAPLPKYLNEVGRINEDEMFEEVCVSPSPEDDACSADMIFIATANPTAILELLGRLEAAEKDAARYRAIAADPYFDGYAWWTQDICIIETDDANKPPTKDQVGEAVDAAMKDEQK